MGDGVSGYWGEPRELLLLESTQVVATGPGVRVEKDHSAPAQL